MFTQKHVKLVCEAICEAYIFFGQGTRFDATYINKYLKEKLPSTVIFPILEFLRDKDFIECHIGQTLEETYISPKALMLCYEEQFHLLFPNETKETPLTITNFNAPVSNSNINSPGASITMNSNVEDIIKAISAYKVDSVDKATLAELVKALEANKETPKKGFLKKFDSFLVKYGPLAVAVGDFFLTLYSKV